MYARAIDVELYDKLEVKAKVEGLTVQELVDGDLIPKLIELSKGRVENG